MAQNGTSTQIGGAVVAPNLVVGHSDNSLREGVVDEIAPKVTERVTLTTLNRITDDYG